jgi:hypothetical protein
VTLPPLERLERILEEGPRVGHFAADGDGEMKNLSDLSFEAGPNASRYVVPADWAATVGYDPQLHDDLDTVVTPLVRRRLAAHPAQQDTPSPRRLDRLERVGRAVPLRG